ncbi:type IV pilus modification protein PilV [Ferrimonas balearica]|uniref:type IV pilus modification protein PilV n=1 Tax=Ferrimonas balearica TaxID=44012 RepID=UPI001C55BB04|nr:type IV pilus modification protein PilV [Ferrimonas balearica]MBW3140802.1 type IV pilus modification protein PilV [Ferrimonas balearica]MBW3165221.1 type IV pilus modification protein PilV [Ferrimonas balearica]MBY6107394.1 type IV pilus modification protein PilV [Ferrimonas balearica]MBY6225875.1 type IV pilus modification protein PilV [Ferrimonas balearica]
MRRQQGITLIEVLVAAVVITVGLLGVFQLHLTAKRGSFESYNYTQALSLASDVIERIRVNPSRLANYAAINYGSGSYTLPSTPCHESGGAINRCTPDQMLLWDQYLWDQQLLGTDERIGERNLGSPADMTGCIYVSGNDVEVVVSWRGMNATRDGAGEDSSNCGTADNHRRMVRVETVIVEGV